MSTYMNEWIFIVYTTQYTTVTVRYILPIINMNKFSSSFVSKIKCVMEIKVVLLIVERVKSNSIFLFNLTQNLNWSLNKWKLEFAF